MTKAKKPTTRIIISYVPLLTGDPTQLLDREGIEKNAVSLSTQIDEANNHVECVLWYQDHESKLHITFAINKGDDVYNHLMNWAEGNPAKWFTLEVATDDTGYAIVLHPDLDASINRHKAISAAFDMPTMSDDTYTIFYKPLTFTCKVPRAHVRRLGQQAHTQLSITDTNNISKSTNTPIDPNKVHIVGQINIAPKSEYALNVLKEGA